MQKKLLQNQKSFDGKSRQQMKALASGFAEEIGLDVNTFHNDFNEESYGKIIETDKNLGNKRGVKGTPAFLVNGTLVTGNISKDRLESIVREHIRQARGIIRKGVEPRHVYPRAVRMNLRESTDE